MCSYEGDSGTNASFLIHAFGVFWLESTTNKSITGRFVQYQSANGGSSVIANLTGIWHSTLVD
jgi:hypothetical protein